MLKEIHYFKVVLQKAHVNQTGMNQFYLYIPKQSGIAEKMFSEYESDTEITMIDRNDLAKFEFKMIFENNEFRFRKDTGKYFRKYELNAGDEVIVQKKVYVNNTSDFFISVVKYTDKSSFSYNSSTNSYLIDYAERLNDNLDPFKNQDHPGITVLYEDNEYEINISFLGKYQKRKMIYDNYHFEGLDQLFDGNLDFSLYPIEKGKFKLKLVEKYSYACTRMGEM